MDIIENTNIGKESNFSKESNVSKESNFSKDMIIDLCNLCSVSYTTNEVLTQKYNNKEFIFDKCGKCPVLKETQSDCQYFTTIL